MPAPVQQQPLREHEQNLARGQAQRQASAAAKSQLQEGVAAMRAARQGMRSAIRGEKAAK